MVGGGLIHTSAGNLRARGGLAENSERATNAVPNTRESNDAECGQTPSRLLTGSGGMVEGGGCRKPRRRFHQVSGKPISLTRSLALVIIRLNAGYSQLYPKDQRRPHPLPGPRLVETGIAAGTRRPTLGGAGHIPFRAASGPKSATGFSSGPLHRSVTERLRIRPF